jgi:hypothetical protein
MQKECISYITKPGKRQFTIFNVSESLPPSIDKVIGLYCDLRGIATVKEFSEENNLESLNIDERRFITFGVVNKLISRIHKYPLKLPRKIKKEDNLVDPIKR